jgi:uncharacterized damage-inducible protein DinB
MSFGEQQRLAAFSDTVRNSTLKRLRRVPEGAENWAVREGAMSFADLADHILQCDYALLKIFETKLIGAHVGKAGQRHIETRAEFDDLVGELKQLRKTRREFIGTMTESDFDVIIDAERIRGVERIPAGILMLEMLDHEVHHRGQMALALSLYEADGGTLSAPSQAADLTRF